MLLELALFILFLAVVARWMVAGPASRGGPQLEAQHTAELARLREEVDTLTAQVVRLQDEQSFMMRLLTAGRGQDDAAPPEAGGAPEAPTTNPEKA
jgi:outer membrane murein-binding lipoprotein Lpp